jgi:hypothetical protein
MTYTSVREMIRSISYSRYFRIPIPMPTGSARIANETISDTIPVVNEPASRPRLIATTPPLSSHLSCWRRSPVERRQLSTW